MGHVYLTLNRTPTAPQRNHGRDSQHQTTCHRSADKAKTKSSVEVLLEHEQCEASSERAEPKDSSASGAVKPITRSSPWNNRRNLEVLTRRRSPDIQRERSELKDDEEPPRVSEQREVRRTCKATDHRLLHTSLPPLGSPRVETAAAKCTSQSFAL